MEKKFLMVVALLWAVVLFHDTKDDVVPVENFYAMSKFLKDNGIKTQEFVGEYSSEATKEAGITNHEVAAAVFFLRIIEWVRANYLFFRPTCR